VTFHISGIEDSPRRVAKWSRQAVYMREQCDNLIETNERWSCAPYKAGILGTQGQIQKVWWGRGVEYGEGIPIPPGEEHGDGATSPTQNFFHSKWRVLMHF